MPQLGETVTEGTITEWFKQVGDEVAEDEPLFEVSTDKVDSEVPSPASGVLREIIVAEGETVDVGTKLAVLGDGSGAGDSDPGEDDGGADEPSAAAPDEPEAPEQPAPADEPPEQAAVVRPAEQSGVPASREGGSAGDGLVLSPVVRRLIVRHDLDPDAIEGTGLGGRITRSDVQAMIDKGATSAPPPSTRARSGPAGPSVVAGRGDQVVALSNIRRRTGEHMVMSKQTSPHVLTAVEVDFEAVERVRRAHRETWKQEEGFSLTYLPFICRALVDALEDHPHLNASVDADGTELIVHDSVNIAIAVDLDFEGLLAPVVKEAEDKRLPAIARDIRDLADRARTKKLSADEIHGGTFTLTNPGQYGTLMQFPVINQPQVAILSTDGVHRKPVVVTDDDGNEAIAIHSVGVLALAWDHRAFDGAYAASFLARLREIIETRDWEPEL
jgi:2-oxoglutarate dehydrogenase E2 component (dihydrolipoamide succinyltransferase)